MGHADPDSYLWQIGIEYGRTPHFASDSNIDGILVYLQDVRQHCPGQCVFVTNANSRGVSPLLAPVLACAGLRARGPAVNDLTWAGKDCLG